MRWLGDWLRCLSHLAHITALSKQKEMHGWIHSLVFDDWISFSWSLCKSLCKFNFNLTVKAKNTCKTFLLFIF